MKALVELYRYFDKNRIYLPPETSMSLDKLVDDVRSHVVKFGVYVERNYGDPDRVARDKNEAWDRGWHAIKDQVPAARASLEAELRALLGGPCFTLAIVAALSCRSRWPEKRKCNHGVNGPSSADQEASRRAS